MSGRARALLAVALANVVWSGSYVAGKAALGSVSFATLNALRFTLAALLVAPLLWRNRHRLPRSRADRVRLVAMALLAFCGNKALEFGGLSLSTATDTALLITSEALMTALLAAVFLRERLRGSTLAALLVGGVGVYLVVEGGPVLPHGISGSRPLGDVLIVASLAVEACATVIGSSLMSRAESAFTVTCAAVVISLAVWVPVGTAVGLAGASAPRLGAAGWAGVAYLAVAVTVCGYGLWFWGLGRLRAQDVTPFLLLQPLVGTLLAALIRGERPGPWTLAGGAGILAGVALVAWCERRGGGVEAVPLAGPGPG